MLTPLMKELLCVYAEQGDYGFLMSADAFDDSADPLNQAFGRLLRNYVHIQTNVRMSQPIPLEVANAFATDNHLFDLDERKYIGGGYSDWYCKQLGPFYLAFCGTQASLTSNFHWLEEQPIREIEINNVRMDNDLKMLVRNHRFQYQQRVTFRFSWNAAARANASEVAAIVREMTGHSLVRLNLGHGINDRLGIIRATFQGNRTIQKGCELYYGTNRIHIKR